MPTPTPETANALSALAMMRLAPEHVPTGVESFSSRSRGPHSSALTRETMSRALRALATEIERGAVCVSSLETSSEGRAGELMINTFTLEFWVDESCYKLPPPEMTIGHSEALIAAHGIALVADADVRVLINYIKQREAAEADPRLMMVSSAKYEELRQERQVLTAERDEARRQFVEADRDRNLLRRRNTMLETEMRRARDLLHASLSGRSR